MRFKGNLMTAPSALTIAVLALVAAGCIPAAAQIEKLVYTFQGQADGSHPSGGLVADREGHMFGTTVVGGKQVVPDFPLFPFGTVFELTPPETPGGTWNKTTLYEFETTNVGGLDGILPYSPLLLDEDGNLYGTTYSGGDYVSVQCFDLTYHSCGTVFKLTRPREPGGAWQESVLYRFSGFDGAGPVSGLTRGKGGKLYGATMYGGAYLGLYSGGTVFELTPPDEDHPNGPWTEKVLHNFDSPIFDNPRGSFPNDVVLDREGNLYGTAFVGGEFGAGLVFELIRPSVPGGDWTETILYSFTGGSDGGYPWSGAVFDERGNLYGATAAIFGGQSMGGGTVYQLTRPETAGGAWTEHTLYQFTGGNDGANPVSKPILDREGRVLGTTSTGNGGLNAACAPNCGTVYELTPPGPGASSWSERTLHEFNGSPDGATGALDGSFLPGSLLLGRHGKLFGTMPSGGDANGDGVVFEITRKREGGDDH